MNHSQSILSLHGVEKTFRPDIFKPPFQSLKGVDLEFPAGTCTGLVGHNGAGKTTTIRLILGLISPDKGAIFFRDHPMSRLDRSAIGYMAESARFPSGLTPTEILETQLTLHRVKSPQGRRQLILERLASVGLERDANRIIRGFSKGMQQRLAWAHATIHDPDVLILDEPFTGLDPLGRITMKNWIMTEKKRGVTIILCTHELPQIMSLCDHLHILRHGRLVYSSYANRLKNGLLDETLPRYFVDISGAQSADLDRMLTSRQLPKWKSLDEDGFILRLGFSDYPSAAAWLQPCLERGFVIARFGDDNSATEEQLLTHFKEEFSR